VGCKIPSIEECLNIWQTRKALRSHILDKVNDAYNVLMKRHITTYHDYLCVTMTGVGTTPDESTNALKAALHARHLLIEGTLAWRYFIYMLRDVEKSAAVGDVFTMNVPYVPVLDLDYPQPKLKQRVFKSAFPALLRAMPNHESIHRQDSTVDPSNDPSSMKLGSYSPSDMVD